MLIFFQLEAVSQPSSADQCWKVLLWLTQTLTKTTIPKNRGNFWNIDFLFCYDCQIFMSIIMDIFYFFVTDFFLLTKKENVLLVMRA